MAKDDANGKSRNNNNNNNYYDNLTTGEWSNSAIDLTNNNNNNNKNDTTATITTRPKSYVGSQSDLSSYTLRRHSVDEASLRNNEIFNNNSSSDRPQKLKIRQVIDNSSSSNDNNVEFIVQVNFFF